MRPFKMSLAICRICGANDNLMHVLQGGQELLKKLSLCANIKIDFEDDLPKHLCLQCEQSLNLAYRLRKQGEAMNQKLRQQHDSNNVVHDLCEEVDDIEEELLEFRVKHKEAPSVSVVADEDVQVVQSNNVKEVKPVAAKNVLMCIDPKVSNNYLNNSDYSPFNIVNNKVVNSIKNCSVRLKVNADTQIENMPTNADILEQFLPMSMEEQAIQQLVPSELNHNAQDEVQIVAEYVVAKTLDTTVQVLNAKTDDDYTLQSNTNSGDQLLSETTACYKFAQQEIDDDVQIIEDFPENIVVSAVEPASTTYEMKMPEYGNVLPLPENENLQMEPPKDDDGIKIIMTHDNANIEEELIEESLLIEPNYANFETEEKYSIDLVDDVIVIDGDEAEQECVKNGGTLKLYTQYKCDTCAETFTNNTEYRTHIKQHGRERFHCIQCNKWFPARYRLLQHERVHNTTLEMHCCSYCKINYRYRSNLMRHIRSAHSKEKIFPCEECPDIFTRPDTLKVHMLKHTTERKYDCDQCYKTFKSQLYLNTHKRTHLTSASTTSTDTSGSSPQHTGKQRTYHCDECGKISKHHFAHKNHLRTHTRDRPYTCQMCGKQFRTIAARLTHERIHGDTRPYHCNRCFVTFRQSSHLKDHMLIHDGIMSFVCSVCNMAFTKKSNMKVHMRIHTGERPYACAETTCGEQFAKLAQLKRHAAKAHARDVDVAPGEENDDDEDEQEDEVEEIDDDDEGNDTVQEQSQLDLMDDELDTDCADDELSDRRASAEAACFNAIINDDELDVGIGAEETATELVVTNEAAYDCIYDLIN